MIMVQAKEEYYCLPAPQYVERMREMARDYVERSLARASIERSYIYSAPDSPYCHASRGQFIDDLCIPRISPPEGWIRSCDVSYVNPKLHRIHALLTTPHFNTCVQIQEHLISGVLDRAASLRTQQRGCG